MNRIPTLGGLCAELRSRWPEWTTISVFAAVVAFAIPYHEPWADEAQAWQLARSLSLRELFQTYIRYEATPGLWHFLLWIMNRVHVSYAGMHWICGLIAVVAASLLVLNSPFPRYLKLTLPFTFFLLFQYAVIARSYLLVPLLLFESPRGGRKARWLWPLHWDCWPTARFTPPPSPADWRLSGSLSSCAPEAPRPPRAGASSCCAR